MAKTILKKDKTVNVKMKTGGQYSYKFTTLSQIHEYLEESGQSYYAFVSPMIVAKNVNGALVAEAVGEDHMFIQKLDKDGNPLGDPIRGARIKNSDNMQEYGGNLTSARRYSLLLAYGLACEEEEQQGAGGDEPSGKNGKPTSRQMDYLKQLLQSVKGLSYTEAEKMAEDYDTHEKASREIARLIKEKQDHDGKRVGL